MENNELLEEDYTGIYKPGVVITALLTLSITLILPILTVGIYVLV